MSPRNPAVSPIGSQRYPVIAGVAFEVGACAVNIVFSQGNVISFPDFG
jgi:hypothetical protein